MRTNYSIAKQQKLKEKFLQMKAPEDLASGLHLSINELINLAIHPVYFKMEIKEKGNKKRILNAPNERLKKVQKYLNEYLQAVYFDMLPANVHGFVKSPDDTEPKRSIRTNASLHCGKPFLINMDIKNFFPSVKAQLVREMFMKEPFLFEPELASALSLLCVYKNSLPVGSPVSPVLSNFVFYPLDLKLELLAKDHGYTYSRYADDLTFSGNERPNEQFLESVKLKLATLGLKLNKRKYRVCSQYSCQTVTGLKVNEKTNIDRKYVRLLRAVCHDYMKNGKEAAARRYYKKEMVTEFDIVNFEISLRAKIKFVKDVNPEAVRNIRFISFPEKVD